MSSSPPPEERADAATVLEMLRLVRALAALDRAGQRDALEQALQAAAHTPPFSVCRLVRARPWLAEPLTDMFRQILYGLNEPAQAERLFAARILATEDPERRIVLRALGNGVIAHLAGYGPDVCAESVRFSLPDRIRPSYAEMMEILSLAPDDLEPLDVPGALAALCRPPGTDDPDSAAVATRLARTLLPLGGDSLRLLLRSVDKTDLAIALLGVTPPLAAALVEAMSARAQRLFLRDMREHRDDPLCQLSSAEIRRRQTRILGAAEVAGFSVS